MEALSESRGTGGPLLSIQAVADRLAVSRATVYRLIQAGELMPLRVMSRARFRPEDVEAYLARQAASDP
jgi:excisionase family DNA binding protein